MPERGDEFYVGYLNRSPRRIAARVRIVVATAIAVGLAVALVLASAQSRFDDGTFEFGIDRTWDGVIVERPYPMLLVPSKSSSTWTTHLLVAFGKRGAADVVGGLDGRAVRVTGSRIANERQEMIEVHDIEPLADARSATWSPSVGSGEISLGRSTWVGEIVDAKCHLGVMKPGRGKAHRACAILCIRGGIPPILRVEDRRGRVDYLMLEDTAGRPVNDRVLELVAVPVEITGEVVRRGDRLVLVADPATYRRIAG